MTCEIYIVSPTIVDRYIVVIIDRCSWGMQTLLIPEALCSPGNPPEASGDTYLCGVITEVGFPLPMLARRAPHQCCAESGITKARKHASDHCWLMRTTRSFSVVSRAIKERRRRNFWPGSDRIPARILRKQIHSAVLLILFYERLLRQSRVSTPSGSVP